MSKLLSKAVCLLAPVCIGVVVLANCAHGSEAEVRKWMLELTEDSKDTRKAAIESLTKTGDMRLLGFFKAFTASKVYFWKGQLVFCENAEKGTELLDALTLAPLPGNLKATPAIAAEWKPIAPMGQGERNRVTSATSLLGLFSDDSDVRKDSVVTCAKNEIESSIPTLVSILAKEPNRRVRLALEDSIARLRLVKADGKTWTPEYLESIAKLGDLSSGGALSKLQELETANFKGDNDPQAAKALHDAIGKIESWQRIAHGAEYVFQGISSGSLLILMALGLSIIFGLMGVINMAHGELVMIGAYTTYVTQRVFQICLPESIYNFHFILAIPMAFAVTALAGFMLEKLIIRHLYGRPLETLLATWGVSLILIQTVRLIFGDNISVQNPTWFRGGVEIMQDVSLSYNRLFIIGFCLLCIALMYWIIEKTKLGLLLRATTQNRNMAASLGVPTRRIDGYTFAIGAGLAGLAGCAATLTDGVTPNMGSNYIVYSFLVVVAGGVGKLAGAIWAGLGLGVLNKFFDPFLGTTWGSVTILICVVLFIQWRPSGLFPAKGRTADA